MKRVKIVSKRCKNPLFEKWLTEWKELAAEQGSEAQHTYARALRSLRKFPLVLTSGKACIVLEYFGSKTCEMLDKKLAEYKQGLTEEEWKEMTAGNSPLGASPIKKKIRTSEPKHLLHLNSNDGRAGAVAAPNVPVPAARSALQPLEIETENTDVVANGKYVPKYRSCPFALLIALYNQFEAGVSSMTKAELIKAAQPLCDTSLTKAQPGSFYCGWSSMSTLIKKDLVIKKGNPTQFILTASGYKLGGKLANFSEDDFKKFEADTPPSSVGYDGTDSGPDFSGNATSWTAGCETSDSTTHHASQALPSIQTTHPTASSSKSSSELCSQGYVPRTCSITSMTASSSSKSCSQGSVLKTMTTSTTASSSSKSCSQGSVSRTCMTISTTASSSSKSCSQGSVSRTCLTTSTTASSSSKSCSQGSVSRTCMTTSTTASSSSKSCSQGSVSRTCLTTSTTASSSSKSCSQGSFSRTCMTTSTTASSKSCSQSYSSSFDSQSSTQCYASDMDCRTSIPSAMSSSSQLRPSSFSSKASTQLSSSSYTEAFSLPSSSATASQSEDLESSEDPYEAIFLLPGNFDIVLLVDIHETEMQDRKRVASTLQQLLSCGLKVEMRHLTVGDFVWVARDRAGSELTLPYIVERKRMDDLASGIKNGRFHEQKFRLKGCGLPNVIYLVEKYGNAQRLGLPMATLLQAATNTEVVDEFIIKVAKSSEDSIRYLTCFTKQLVSVFKDKTLMSCPKRSLPPLDIHSDIISLMVFKQFNKDSTKTKNWTVKDMLIKQLIQLNNLSVDKATAIAERYPTPAALVALLTSGSGEKTLTDLPYSALKKVGPAISNSLKQLYTLDTLP